MPAAAALPDVEDDVLDRLEPMYHVVLLDDNDHTYDYVVEMLTKIFGFSEAVAFRHAVEVDTNGRTIVLTAAWEEARRKQEAIHAYGADWRLERSKGSMSAILEPAGSEAS